VGDVDYRVAISAKEGVSLNPSWTNTTWPHSFILLIIHWHGY
jgi:hypothetical protein